MLCLAVFGMSFFSFFQQGLSSYEAETKDGSYTVNIESAGSAKGTEIGPWNR